ncbi:MAG: hypothetical protein HS099_28625 [Ardenticatenaceae bacterium]|nr:hypothetical protein [Ardenticatenaceae bacterium]
MSTQHLTPLKKAEGLRRSYEEFLAWDGKSNPFLAFCEIRSLPPEKAQEIQQLLRSGG